MKDGHSRDTGNTEHKTQDEIKQNKQKNTTQKTKKTIPETCCPREIR